MKYIIKPIVCDYAVICVDTGELMCICNIKRNAELIADILNADNDNSCAFSYDLYPNAKYTVVKTEESEEELNPSAEKTAESQPIVRGTWKAKNFHTFTCSNCNNFDLDIMKEYHFEKYLHCPFCGVKMKARKNDGQTDDGRKE